MASARLVQLGGFQLDHASGELSRAGRKVRLPAQSLRVLQVLLEHAGDVVTRDELRERVWTADTFVDFDAGLNNAVKKLRDALEDSSEQPRFIETVPRRGYRLIVSPEVPRPARPSRRVLGGVSVLAMVAIGVALSLGVTRSWLVRRLGDTSPPAIRSIVVLPFQNLTGDPAQEFVVEGVGDALTTDLAQIGTLRVISRTSAHHYKGTTKRLTDITRELQVDAAVEGSVSRAGDRHIVRAQLIRATDDHHLWAQTYESEAGNIPAWQGRTALAIARAVHIQVRPDEQQRLARARPVDPNAYDAYLRGRFEWNRRTPEGMLKAIKFFEEAITKDPGYAPGYSGLSDTYRILDLQGLAAPAQAMPKAERAARQALALDDSLAEAHASLAGVLYRYRWDWPAAEREFLRSLELQPNYEEGRRAFGIYLQAMRRFGESVEQLRRAGELNPLSQRRNVELVSALFRAGRREEATAEADRVRGVFPGARGLDIEVAYDHLWRRNWPAAITAFEKAAPNSNANEWLGYCYGMAGRTSDARAMLAGLHETAKARYVSPDRFAVVHFGLGEREEAFRWLEQAFEQRTFDLRMVTIGLFSFLHDDARFQDLLRRMGLAELKEFNPRQVGVVRSR